MSASTASTGFFTPFGLAQAVVLSDGWRRRFIALLAGAIGALAMAPFDIVPAIIVPMTLAVWLIDGCAHADIAGRSPGRNLAASLWAAAATGWWWGLGYFVAGLWWLGSAFLAEPKFVWLLPFGVLGLPAYLAVFPAFGFALARLLWSTGPGRVVALAVALSAAEWLRGLVLTGFPWNEFGMALGGNLVLAQAAGAIGVHGLTLLTVMMAAAPATLADAGAFGGGAGRRCSPWPPCSPSPVSASPASARPIPPTSRASSCGSCSPTRRSTPPSTMPTRTRSSGTISTCPTAQPRPPRRASPT
jgi:apolipoprotein N-acyltransferase